MLVSGAESGLIQHRDHCGGGMDEGSERLAAQSAHEVLEPERRPRHNVGWRMAEHQKPTCVAASGGQQTLVIGVAADDTVQHHDVRRLDLVRRLRNIEEAPV
jgi:hypothetical protein